MVLGAHHLARYRFDDHGVSKTLCEMQGWPAPDSSVLYNFETVNEQTLLKDIFPRWALKKHLWDYSSASVLRLARLKIERGTSRSGGLTLSSGMRLPMMSRGTWVLCSSEE